MSGLTDNNQPSVSFQETSWRRRLTSWILWKSRLEKMLLRSRENLNDFRQWMMKVMIEAWRTCSTIGKMTNGNFLKSWVNVLKGLSAQALFQLGRDSSNIRPGILEETFQTLPNNLNNSHQELTHNLKRWLVPNSKLCPKRASTASELTNLDLQLLE